MDRVQRVFLVTGNCCDGRSSPGSIPDLLVVQAGGPEAAPLLAPFPAYADGPVGKAGRIYLVDPLGTCS